MAGKQKEQKRKAQEQDRIFPVRPGEVKMQEPYAHARHAAGGTGQACEGIEGAGNAPAGNGIPGRVKHPCPKKEKPPTPLHIC